MRGLKEPRGVPYAVTQGRDVLLRWVNRCRSAATLTDEGEEALAGWARIRTDR
jgi:hypothetical protein